jgi:ornithine carbamoyltransferase
MATARHLLSLTDVGPGFDFVYTTRWQTMGESKPALNWREKFIPYRVTQDVMQRVSNGTGTIFMHDLPAVRGDDVVDEVLDGPQSVAFQQAKNKLFGAMAVLTWCMAGENQKAFSMGAWQ